MGYLVCGIESLFKMGNGVFGVVPIDIDRLVLALFTNLPCLRSVRVPSAFSSSRMLPISDVSDIIWRSEPVGRM